MVLSYQAKWRAYLYRQHKTQRERSSMLSWKRVRMSEHKESTKYQLIGKGTENPKFPSTEAVFHARAKLCWYHLINSILVCMNLVNLPLPSPLYTQWPPPDHGLLGSEFIGSPLSLPFSPSYLSLCSSPNASSTYSH